MTGESTHLGVKESSLVEPRPDSWRLRAWAFLALGFASSIAVIAAISGRSLSGYPLLLFGGTLIVAEHRDRLFGDETSVSGSIVVSMATVLVFASSAWLVGPIVCAAMAGAYWPHLRTRAWSRIGINASAMSLAAAAAAGVFHATWSGTSFLTIRSAGAGLLALLAFWLVNSIVLAVAVASIQRRPFWSLVLELVRSDPGLLPLAYLGFLTGYVTVRVGIIDGWLLLLGVLVLVDRLVIQASDCRTIGTLIGVWAMVSLTSTSFLVVEVVDPSVTSDLVILAVFGLLILAVVDGALPNLDLCVVVAAVVTASITFRGSEPILGPIVVGLATCLPAVVSRDTTRALLHKVSAATLAVLGIGCAATLFSPAVVLSILGCLLVGAAGALAGLVGWHLSLLLWLSAEAEVRVLRLALDVARADIGVVIVAGVLGACGGWIALQDGALGVAVFAVTIGTVVALLGIWSPRQRRRAALADDELLDIVRSALLDLPASRLPEKSQGPNRPVRG